MHCQSQRVSFGLWDQSQTVIFGCLGLDIYNAYVVPEIHFWSLGLIFIYTIYIIYIYNIYIIYTINIYDIYVVPESQFWYLGLVPGSNICIWDQSQRDIFGIWDQSQRPKKTTNYNVHFLHQKVSYDLLSSLMEQLFGWREHILYPTITRSSPVNSIFLTKYLSNRPTKLLKSQVAWGIGGQGQCPAGRAHNLQHLPDKLKGQGVKSKQTLADHTIRLY